MEGTEMLVDLMGAINFVYVYEVNIENPEWAIIMTPEGAGETSSR